MDNSSDSFDDNEELELHHLLSDRDHTSAPSAPKTEDKPFSASAPNHCNLDSDLIKLQERLHLANTVTPFQVA